MNWLFLIEEISHCFRLFYFEVLNQYHTSVKTLQSDSAKEYLAVTSDFQPFLNSHGIIHQTFSLDTPHQNGVAKRKNCHLLNVARSLIFHMHLHKTFWGHAILTACHLINRLPTFVLQGRHCSLFYILMVLLFHYLYMSLVVFVLHIVLLKILISRILVLKNVSLWDTFELQCYSPTHNFSLLIAPIIDMVQHPLQ